MKKFAIRLAVFLAINVAILVALAAYARSERHEVQNGQVEADLPIIPQGQSIDVLVMGTSRGRALSRYGGHQKLEEILGARVLNISKGRGGGVIPQQLFLEYFYDQGNTARRIVYLVDPFVFFSRQWNEDNLLAEDEPFRLDFCWRLLRSPVSPMVVHNYFASKFSIEGLFYRAKGVDLDTWVLDRMGAPSPEQAALEKIDPNLVKRQIANLFPRGADKQTFRRYADVLRDIIRTAQAHNAEIVLVIPPTLLGECPGEQLLRDLLADCAARYGVRCHDLAQAILEPGLYCDHGHLNLAGVEHFARAYLKPMLDGAPVAGLAVTNSSEAP